MKTYLMIAVVLLFACAGSAMALDIPIENGGFESPNIAPATWQYYSLGPGWVSSSYSSYIAISRGEPGVPAPTEGAQSGLAERAVITNTASTYGAVAGSIITFTADFGKYGMSETNWFDCFLINTPRWDSPGMEAYFLRSVAVRPADIPDGGWRTYTNVSGIIPADKAGWHPTFGLWTYPGKTAIDNVRISDDVIPEPSALLALGSGLMGLAGLAIRRRK